METQFTTDELVQARTAVVLAGMAIAKADSSNPRAIEREASAIARSAAEAVGMFADNGLVQDVFGGEHGVASEHVVGMLRSTVEAMSADELEALALRRIEAVSANVAAKLPMPAAEEYRRAFLHVCVEVARAAKEGGFLGIGGVHISQNETAAYAAIEAALYGSKHPESRTGPGVVAENSSMNWLNARPGDFAETF